MGSCELQASRPNLSSYYQEGGSASWMDVVGPQSSVLIVSLPAQLQLFAEKRDLGSIGLDGSLDEVKVGFKLDTHDTPPVSLLALESKV